MEGVGARLGRSSSRYGSTTVFSGPVRKWKKKWVHVSPSSNSRNHSHSNGNNGSHILLYKWTLLSQTNNNNGDKTPLKDDNSPPEPPRKKFRHVPIAAIEVQKKDCADKADEEAKPTEADPPAGGGSSKSDGVEGKPDINDIPVEEIQVMDEDQSSPKESKESSLDLNLGFKAHESDRVSNSNTEDQNEAQWKRVNSSGGTSR